MPRWWKGRPKPDEDVVDLRSLDVIDLRQEVSTEAFGRAPVAQPVVRDGARDEWERSADLVEYPSDLKDWRDDRRRDSVKPGHLIAVAMCIDEDATPDAAGERS